MKSRRVWPAAALSALVCLAGAALAHAEQFHFVVTSDLHYGTSRTFRGAAADAQTVNRAMIDQINALPAVDLPDHAGKIGRIDFVAVTGDITNRAEGTAPPAAVSWQLFQDDYLGHDNAGSRTGGRLTLRDKDAAAVPLFLVAGNHDLSNAIGYPNVTTDPTTCVQISNRMLGTALTVDAAKPLDFSQKPVNYSVDRAGVHLLFVNMWPDRKNQAWMDDDLKKTDAKTPVLLFTHMSVEPGAKYFRNPAAPTTYSAAFAGAIPFTLGPGGDYANTAAAKTELLAWLARHPQVKAYIFGHDHSREFSTLTPDPAKPALVVGLFRADSPMSGADSQKDESKLSFNVFTIDSTAATLTAREYLWNAAQPPATQPTTAKWGVAKSIPLE